MPEPQEAGGTVSAAEKKASLILERASEAKAILRALWPEEVVFPEPGTDPNVVPIDNSACARHNPGKRRPMVSDIMEWLLFIELLDEVEVEA